MLVLGGKIQDYVFYFSCIWKFRRDISCIPPVTLSFLIHTGMACDCFVFRGYLLLGLFLYYHIYSFITNTPLFWLGKTKKKTCLVYNGRRIASLYVFPVSCTFLRHTLRCMFKLFPYDNFFPFFKKMYLTFNNFENFSVYVLHFFFIHFCSNFNQKNVTYIRIKWKDPPRTTIIS